MALSRLGDLIELVNIKSGISNLTIYDVSGINKDKEFFSPTIQVGEDTSNYKIVPPYHFACNLMHVGRDIAIPIALNKSNKNTIVSPAYSVFYVKQKNRLLDEYLYMIFKKIDFDRFAAFCTDSSVRDGLELNRFLEIELELPQIEVQQKAVDVYLAMVDNQKVYEKGLDDLKLTCDAYIEDLKHRNNLFELGNFLEEVTTRNSENRFKLNDVLGVSKNKEIIPTKANSSDNDLSKFTVIEKNDFVYNPRSANAIAINSSLSGGIISWNNTAFRVKKTSHFALLPKYLNLWFSRDEYSRWAKFNSWGSSTELLGLDEVKKYKIAIPELNIQEAIVKVYEAYEMRKRINENLKKHINEICPVLIRGSIDLNQ